MFFLAVFNSSAVSDPVCFVLCFRFRINLKIQAVTRINFEKSNKSLPLVEK